jgi:hypothetical protein
MFGEPGQVPSLRPGRLRASQLLQVLGIIESGT